MLERMHKVHCCINDRHFDTMIEEKVKEWQEERFSFDDTSNLIKMN